MSAPEAQSSARGLTLLVTNLTKLAGVAVGVYEGISQAQPRASVLLFAAFMAAGAQFSEGFLLAFLDRLFGRKS